MKRAALLLLFAFLCACARQPAVPTMPEQDGRTAIIWEAMRGDSMESGNSPYRIRLSMRFGQEGDTRRVTGILWGNDTRKLRLDVMAGVGATIGKISENGDSFLLYAPRENKAYFHNGSNKPLLKMGVPLPFNLSQLAALLNGSYPAVFGNSYSTAEMSGDCAKFELDGGPGGTLTLNDSGLPVAWRRKNGWQLDMTYEDGQPPLPETLKLETPDGKRAILLVKEREKPQPFDSAHMDLLIPPGTKELPLSKYRP